MKAIACLFLLAIPASVLASDPPALPPGLGTQPTLPSLPPGLLIPENTEQPAEQDSAIDDNDEDDLLEDSGITVFWDNRLGYRLHQTDLHDQPSISESRLHLEKDFKHGSLTLQTAVDFLYDPHPDASDSSSLQSGEGAIDLRKFSLIFRASTNIDVRLGRQVLTWGTGDLVFLNDFFPKDWRYWIGRDIEYSKAPSDALKISYYGSVFNVDLVYTPQFDADRFIDGSRLSFYDGRLNQIIGKEDSIDTDIPDDTFHDDEIAYRLYKNFDDMELALYGYHGFYKSPSAFDMSVNRYQFSRLASIGASLRKPVGPGILSLETAVWDSLDDADGRDPLITNGETRVLAGYEWEAGSNFTVGLQYYAEHMQHYDGYLQGLVDLSTKRDQINHMLTLRLSKRLMNEDLKLGVFIYHTLSDSNYFIRPEVNLRLNDEWFIEAGATLFYGDAEHQSWAQFKYNSNIFFAVRYRFTTN